MASPLAPGAFGRSAVSNVPTPVPTAQPAERAPGPRTCLVVDDSRVVRKVSRHIVENLGYQVIEAENGEEALARCRACMPHLILLDWDMPVMSGIQFVTQLRGLQTPHRSKVVFCTSRSETTDIYKGIEAGADEYVTKPFNEASLKAKLDRIGAV